MRRAGARERENGRENGRERGRGLGRGEKRESAERDGDEGERERGEKRWRAGRDMRARSPSSCVLSPSSCVPAVFALRLSFHLRRPENGPIQRCSSGPNPYSVFAFALALISKVLLEYFSWGYLEGLDNTGHAIDWNCLGNLDGKGLHLATSIEEMTRYKVGTKTQRRGNLGAGALPSRPMSVRIPDKSAPCPEVPHSRMGACRACWPQPVVAIHNRPAQLTPNPALVPCPYPCPFPRPFPCPFPCLFPVPLPFSPPFSLPFSPFPLPFSPVPPSAVADRAGREPHAEHQEPADHRRDRPAQPVQPAPVPPDAQVFRRHGKDRRGLLPRVYLPRPHHPRAGHLQPALRHGQARL